MGITMTSIPSGPLPVVLSLEPGLDASQEGLSTNATAVITIPIAVPAERDQAQLSWDELIGKR
jgi:hypothetical protein